MNAYTFSRLQDWDVFRPVHSSLVRRLVRAREDAAKQRLRGYLLAMSDERLRDGLGLTDDDIDELRNG